MALYNMCKEFGKLPSEIESEDPVTMDAFMVISRQLERKHRQDERSIRFKEGRK